MLSEILTASLAYVCAKPPTERTVLLLGMAAVTGPHRFSGLGGVVTGASSGVGRAIALHLATHGASVALVGRNLQRLEAVAADAGTGAVPCRTDLTEDDEIARLAERCHEDLPGVDILVHAAGIISVGPVERALLDDFDSQYETNVRAPYALTQALLPVLRQRNGQVVFINSTAARTGVPGSSQYAATKHALTGIADSLRAEVNSDGVRVLSIFLGRTATPMQQELFQLEGREYRPELLIQPDDVAEIVGCVLALPRTVEVTELAMRPMRKP